MILVIQNCLQLKSGMDLVWRLQKFLRKGFGFVGACQYFPWWLLAEGHYCYLVSIDSRLQDYEPLEWTQLHQLWPLLEEIALYCSHCCWLVQNLSPLSQLEEHQLAHGAPLAPSASSFDDPNQHQPFTSSSHLSYFPLDYYSYYSLNFSPEIQLYSSRGQIHC